MKIKFVFILSISMLILESCANKNFLIAPTFTNVKKISTLQLGQSLNEVNQVLGIYPYDVMTLSEGDLICQYKYRIMERKIPISNKNEFHRFSESDSLSLSSELAQTYGKVFYTDWKDLYVSFKGGKLVSYTSTSGLERANYIMLVNGTIKLLKEKPLEYSHFSENNMFGLNQLNLDSKGSNNGFDSKDRNIVNQILFPLDKDGKFKAFGKTSKNFIGQKK
jgi:hypothetical protein